MGWLGPLRAPAALARGAASFGERCAALFGGERWLWAALAAGIVPLALALPFGSQLHQPVTSVLAFALVVGAVHARKTVKGLAAIAVVFTAHSAFAIAAARFAPSAAASMFPGGADYWAQTHTWLVTGKDPEYELSAWVPQHFQLAGAVLLLSYVSMGLTPFMQGFHEVDLMNFYVGRLLASSGDSTVSLALGWHPWSVMRGVGFTLIVFSIAAASYERFTGLRGAGWRGHALRLAAGLAFLGLDALLKYSLMETVRVALAARLLELTV
jgi:hypothetical protein